MNDVLSGLGRRQFSHAFPEQGTCHDRRARMCPPDRSGGDFATRAAQFVLPGGKRNTRLRPCSRSAAGPGSVSRSQKKGPPKRGPECRCCGEKDVIAFGGRSADAVQAASTMPCGCGRVRYENSHACEEFVSVSATRFSALDKGRCGRAGNDRPSSAFSRVLRQCESDCAIVLCSRSTGRVFSANRLMSASPASRAARSKSCSAAR